MEIITTKDRDIPPAGTKPIFGIDMWEHVYYLQYLNDKQSNVDGVWNIINCKTAEVPYLAGTKQVYWGGILRRLCGKRWHYFAALQPLVD